MILRKPYAFFIKHFKFFNAILTAIQVYLVYKLIYLVQFFFEYSSYPQGSLGQDLVGSLLPTPFYIFQIVSIIFTLFLIAILSFKKKPIKLYLFILIINIFSLIMLFISDYFLGIMQMQIIENRTAFAVRDFLTIVLIAQFFICFLTSFRALGFDIKKFQFGQDIHELNVSDEDNEEFVVQIDVDSNELKRKINKNKRYLKYFLYENKKEIIYVSLLVIGIVVAYFTINANVYFGVKKSGDYVSIDNFMFGIEDAYLTEQDSQGNIVTKDNTIVAIPINIKTISSSEKINIGKFALVIGNTKFYSNIKYKDKINDLGTNYNNQTIKTEFSKYLLVFEVPKNMAGKKMQLYYYSDDDNIIKINVNKINLDQNTTTIESHIGEKMKLDDNIIKNATLWIDDFQINNKFLINYYFCAHEQLCYNSYEYITPSYTSEYDMTILKLNGSLENEDNIDLFTLISRYGKLVYSVNGKTKIQNVAFIQKKPHNVEENNTYYMEIVEEIKSAEHMSFVFEIRGAKYIYSLK